MRACVQRVSRAAVQVGGETVGAIDRGLLVLLGVAAGDTDVDARLLADKAAQLRVFEDDQQRMNLSLLDIQGAMLVISQFTLLGDCRKGRRPAFTSAAPPEAANELYEAFVAAVATHGIHVETGRFRAMMQVELVNDGPVTLLLDSKKLF
jgi:D-tyrosyl-tRNA(Tyr) deacylase